MVWRTPAIQFADAQVHLQGTGFCRGPRQCKQNLQEMVGIAGIVILFGPFKDELRVLSVEQNIFPHVEIARNEGLTRAIELQSSDEQQEPGSWPEGTSRCRRRRIRCAQPAIEEA